VGISLPPSRPRQSQDRFSFVSYLKTLPCVSVYNNLSRFSACSPLPSHGKRVRAKRSAVKEFSGASRLRLMRLFAKIDTRTFGTPSFVTLTFHDNWRKDYSDLKEILNKTLQYIRDSGLDIYYIWRLELQKRGAPHFHFILFFPSELSDSAVESFLSGFRLYWHRLVEPNSAPHLLYGFRVESLTTTKKAFAYVSKYCAKSDVETKFALPGRRWGASRDLPVMYLLKTYLPQAVFNQVKRTIRKLLRSTAKRKKLFKSLYSNKTACNCFVSQKTVISCIVHFYTDYYYSLEEGVLADCLRFYGDAVGLIQPFGPPKIYA